jgi:nitroimidazol reductase NimA-like FMN-containing flavoprotein (pyridoxamine 5'-phosphate oxidase superfamily)
MRRKDREIENIHDKIQIIEECVVCRLGLSLHDQPYVVPLNYGYTFQNDNLILYFHSANEGKKVDILRNNNRVCFEIDCGHTLIEGDKACAYGYAYKSIIGFGRAEIITNKDEKIEGLNQLMRHQKISHQATGRQTGKDARYDFTDTELAGVTVYKVMVEEFTGKQRV